MRIHDTEAMIDLIRAVQVQARADARAGHVGTQVLPDGEETLAAAAWLTLLGIPVERAAPAPRPAPAVVTVPARCAAGGEVYRRGDVAVVLTRGPVMTYTVMSGGAVVEAVTCAPQNWKRAQLAALRAAEQLAVGR
jgi:hypothetical protein